MEKRHWLIQGYDGTNLIYERRVPVWSSTECQVQQILRVLASKASLTFDEILGAYARRGTEIANDLVSVQRDGADATFSCGGNPHFHARVV